MRVARLVLAWLMLCAPLAEARLLVVMPSEQITGGENEDRVQAAKVMGAALLNTLDLLGAEYDVVPPGVAKTEFCRLGVMTYRFGSAGAYTQSYDAVIHCYWRAASLQNSGGYSPDSLSLSRTAAGGPSSGYMTLDVPQLFVLQDGDFNTSTACSLGSSAGSNGYAPPGITMALSTDQSLRVRGISDELRAMDSRAFAGSASGGVRVYISARANVANKQMSLDGNGSLVTNCTDCDSLLSAPGFASNSDSAVLWSSLKPHLSGGTSKPLIIAEVGHFPSVGMNSFVLLAGLAALDSASGGAVFNDDKLPLKLGVQVRGGWRRNARHIVGGISPNDSTNLKAAIDSIASLRIPFVVSVNGDSLGEHASDRFWWERAVPYVRYSPELAPGATAYAAANDWDRLATDIDSAFGRGRRDNVWIAPGFDWVPSNMTRADLSKQDSLFYYLSNAGIKGVVTNGDWVNSDPSRGTGSALASLSPLASRHYVRYGRMKGSFFPNLTTAIGDSGSARFDGHLVSDNSVGYKTPRYLERFWRGIVEGRTRPYGIGGQNADSLGYVSQINPRIYTIHASDLGSGVRDDAATRPSMPGWWQIKYLRNSIEMVNRLCGRTVLKIEYPEAVAAQQAGRSRP